MVEDRRGEAIAGGLAVFALLGLSVPLAAVQPVLRLLGVPMPVGQTNIGKNTGLTVTCGPPGAVWPAKACETAVLAVLTSKKLSMA